MALIPVKAKYVVQLAKVVVQDILYVIFNHSYMWCSEPFIYLILSPKEFGVWMLEVWPVNNKN